jgi:3-deoxy-D-manno-octulosonic-acid transferase
MPLQNLTGPLWLYRTASALAEPLAHGLLLQRRRRGKEDPSRMGERRGLAGLERPDGPLIWLHGASVGETISITPLVERLLARGFNVLVTSGTVTSAAVLARRLPPGTIHQYIPLDVPRYMRRFMDHWHPDLAVVAESEIWPNMIIEAKRRDIPMVLVNARMSDRSHRRWLKLAKTSRALLSAFDLCLTQSREDAERLTRLGAPRAVVAGNLKFDVPPPPADASALALLEGLTAGRHVWLAASTHAGEDELVISAHRRMAPHLHNLLTIIAPRHPQRGADIAELARGEGLQAARRSDGQQPDRAVDIYIADTVGEMGLFYRLCPIVFMGGSLIPRGGQNPIEPAKLATAILHGPYIHNFTDVFAVLDASNGARQIEDAEQLARGVYVWLADAAAARDAARAAANAVNEISGAVDRTMRAIEPLLLRTSMAWPGFTQDAP